MRIRSSAIRQEPPANQYRKAARAGTAVISTMVTIGLLSLYAFAPKLVDRLPDSTWFVVLFVASAVAVMFLLRWLARRRGL